eukprot:6463575-Amphidinium_carterae.5
MGKIPPWRLYVRNLLRHRMGLVYQPVHRMTKTSEEPRCLRALDGGRKNRMWGTQQGLNQPAHPGTVLLTVTAASEPSDCRAIAVQSGPNTSHRYSNMTTNQISGLVLQAHSPDQPGRFVPRGPKGESTFMVMGVTLFSSAFSRLSIKPAAVFPTQSFVSQNLQSAGKVAGPGRSGSQPTHCRFYGRSCVGIIGGLSPPWLVQEHSGDLIGPSRRYITTLTRDHCSSVVWTSFGKSYACRFPFGTAALEECLGQLGWPTRAGQVATPTLAPPAQEVSQLPPGAPFLK